MTCFFAIIHKLCVSAAGVAELVDALDLGSSGLAREGSSPFARTNAGTRNFG